MLSKWWLCGWYHLNVVFVLGRVENTDPHVVFKMLPSRVVKNRKCGEGLCGYILYRICHELTVEIKFY